MVLTTQLLRGLVTGALLAGLLAFPGLSFQNDAVESETSPLLAYETVAEGTETQTTLPTLSALHPAWAVPTPSSTTGTQETTLGGTEETIHPLPTISAPSGQTFMTADLSNSGLLVLVVLGTIYGVRKLQIRAAKRGSVTV